MMALTRRTRTTLAVLCVMLSGGSAVMTNDRARGAVAAVLADPLAVLAGRSPGERRAGALAQTKPYLGSPALPGSALPFVPTERVLSGGRLPEPGIPFVAAPPFDVVPLFAPAPPFDDAGFFAPAGPGGGFFPGGPGGGFLPPGGGGGGGIVVPPDDGDGGVVPPPPPPSPVPEPAGWAMMIFGFMVIGGVLRRRSAHAGRSVRDAPDPS